MDKLKALEMILNALVTLGAAFAGAWAAFKYQRSHEAAKLRIAQVEECNRTVLVLMQQANIVLNIRRQIMDPFQNDARRHFLMPPVRQVNYLHLVTNAAALVFLLKTEAAEAPQIVAFANDKFHRFVEAVNDRALVHREFQAALEASSFDKQGEGTFGEMEAAVGMRLTMVMKSATDAVFMLAEAAESSLNACGRDLPRVFRQVFKGEKIIGFTPDDQDKGASRA